MSNHPLEHSPVAETTTSVVRQFQASKLRVESADTFSGRGVLVIAVDDEAVEIHTSLGTADAAALGLEGLVAEAGALAKRLRGLCAPERDDGPLGQPSTQPTRGSRRGGNGI